LSFDALKSRKIEQYKIVGLFFSYSRKFFSRHSLLALMIFMQMKNFYSLVFTVNKTGKIRNKVQKVFLQKI